MDDWCGIPLRRVLGVAVGAPWRGRRVDRRGLRRALVPSVVSQALVWSVVPQLPFPWLLAAVFLGGVFALPVFSVVRQSIGVLPRGPQRDTAFALDAIIPQTIFMMGPALGAVVATGWSSAWGLALVGWSSALAGAYLIWFNPPTRSAQVVGAGRAEAGVEEGTGASAEAGPAVSTEAYSTAEDLERAVHGAPTHLELTATEVPTGALPVIRADGEDSAAGAEGAIDAVGTDGTDDAAGADSAEEVRPAPGPASGAALDVGALLSDRQSDRLRSDFIWMGGTALTVLAVSLGAGPLMVGTEVSIVAELQQVDLAGQMGIVLARWCGASAAGGLLYGASGRSLSPLLLLAVFAAGVLPMALVDGAWPLALVGVAVLARTVLRRRRGVGV